MSGGPSDISARWNRGDDLSSFSPEERQRLREDMRAQAATLDVKSPDRARFMADLRQLYEIDFPNRPEPNTAVINGRMIDLNARGGQ